MFYRGWEKQLQYQDINGYQEHLCDRPALNTIGLLYHHNWLANDIKHTCSNNLQTQCNHYKGWQRYSVSTKLHSWKRYRLLCKISISFLSCQESVMPINGCVDRTLNVQSLQYITILYIKSFMLMVAKTQSIFSFQFEWKHLETTNKNGNGLLQTRDAGRPVPLPGTNTCRVWSEILGGGKGMVLKWYLVAD